MTYDEKEEPTICLKCGEEDCPCGDDCDCEPKKDE